MKKINTLLFISLLTLSTQLADATSAMSANEQIQDWSKNGFGPLQFLQLQRGIGGGLKTNPYQYSIYATQNRTFKTLTVEGIEYVPRYSCDPSQLSHLAVSMSMTAPAGDDSLQAGATYTTNDASSYYMASHSTSYVTDPALTAWANDVACIVYIYSDDSGNPLHTFSCGFSTNNYTTYASNTNWAFTTNCTSSSCGIASYGAGPPPPISCTDIW